MMDCKPVPDPSQILKAAFVEYTKKDSDIVRANGAKPVSSCRGRYADSRR